MKRIFPTLFALILALSFFTGCGQTVQNNVNNNVNNVPDDEDKLSVVSTIFPGYDFTREIAGETVSLSMLLPPGSESHSFEPTPQDIIKIQNCDVFIYIGGESDAWVEGILDSIDTSGMTILSMMDLVDVVEEKIKEGMEDDEHGHDDEHDEEHETEQAEYDEHVWTSPINAIRITKAITDTLCALDGKNAGIYQANRVAYTDKLERLDSSFREVVQSAGRDTLIFGDRFPFRYFVDEYGLDYFAAFPGCSTETEASAKTVAFLIDKVSAENIPVVFHIEFSNEKMADTICESTGAKKLLLHSCHNVTKSNFENGASYLELMAQNLENLREALT